MTRDEAQALSDRVAAVFGTAMPADPYATSWDALMPALQVWLRADPYGNRSTRFWWALRAVVNEGGTILEVDRFYFTTESLAFLFATPEDICNAVIRVGT